MRVVTVIAGLLLAAVLSTQALAQGDPYLGVRHEINAEPPGLLISVAPGTPADLAGLRSGDVITALAGTPFSGEPGTYVDQLREALTGLGVGDVIQVSVFRELPELSLSVDGTPVEADDPLTMFESMVDVTDPGSLVELSGYRNQQLLEIPVALGARPGTDGPPFAANTELGCDLPDTHPGVRTLLEDLSANAGIEADNLDLIARLSNRAGPDDGYKLSRMVYLLRDGLKAEAVTLAITDRISQAAKLGPDGYIQAQACAADLIDLPDLYTAAPMLRSGISAEDHLDIMELVLTTADLYVQAAFANFTPAEIAFIESQRFALTEIFSKEHYIDSDDDDQARARENIRLVELAKRIDYEQLLMAQLTLAQLTSAEFLTGLRDDLRLEFDGQLDKAVVSERETAVGRIVVSGTGSTWQRGEPPVLLIDLGGDDFYTTTAGSGTAAANRLGIILELGGKDAYESTTLFSQGTGSLGCGLLVDLDGDDQYVGTQWAQGCGFFGCGALVDLAGNDVYRGEEFCQAAAIFGTGILLDLCGDDRMEGQMKCQAFGGSRAAALLIDAAGDDYRYCKGKYQTGYGDPGIFDAWGQGCAMGFRGISSGGIAGVIDLAGSDYCEAGNFSQGGGYYFGYGFHHDRGWEADEYIGSRYNQGFCAHQAVGVFLEDGGDDQYLTRQAVAQGLAWDECCTMFIDYAGDDTYRGGTGFSQGASAHNALCVMWDRGGRDSYHYAPGQARAGGNDYHGGTSLSLFIDEGGDLDFYDAARSGNNMVTGWPEHGFFADLDGPLALALADEHWLELYRKTD